MTTPIYELSDAYVERQPQLDPVGATGRGIIGYDDKMTDYSPDGDGGTHGTGPDDCHPAG